MHRYIVLELGTAIHVNKRLLSVLGGLAVLGAVDPAKEARRLTL